MVMIGVDPHKRTHTAVAIDEHETVIGERLVFARAGQVAELVGWADQVACRDRVWAVESAGGLTTKTAIRALKRRLSNVIYRHLVADAQRARTA